MTFFSDFFGSSFFQPSLVSQNAVMQQNDDLLQTIVNTRNALHVGNRNKEYQDSAYMYYYLALLFFKGIYIIVLLAFIYALLVTENELLSGPYMWIAKLVIVFLFAVAPYTLTCNIESINYSIARVWQVLGAVF